MRDLGAWMKVNSAAIYGTRAIAPFKEGQVAYTRGPGNVVNAVYLPREDEAGPPVEMVIPSFVPASGTEVRMLGVREPLKWERRGKGCVVQIPAGIRRSPPASWAWVVVLKDAGAN
jgi:alpha-L-fucosidase